MMRYPMSTMLLPLCFGLAILSTACQAPQPTTPASEDPLGRQLDALFKPWNLEDSPGAAVVVTKDGDTIYRRGFGMASLASGERITPDGTLFDLQSVSKQMTAYAVHLLHQRGQLHLDDEVRQHLLRVPSFDAPITLRQLIHHSSGLREYLDLASLHHAGGSGPLTQEGVWAWLEDQEDLNFEPGTATSYSNTGYLVLAEVVASVAGVSFHTFMAQEVFRPLGMTQTRVRSYGADGQRLQTRSYGPRSGWSARFRGRFQPVPNRLATWGGGGIATTADDLTLWLDHLRTARVEPDVVQAMVVPGSLRDGTLFDYGSGIRLLEERGHRVFAHGGAGEAFRSWAGWVPDLGLTIAILGNSYPGIGGLETDMLNLLLDHYGIPEDPKPGLTSEPLSRWVGHYAEGVVRVRIEEHGDGLKMYSATSPEGRPIQIQADGRFLAGQTEMMSLRGSDGHIAGLQFRSGADVFTLERFEPITASANPGAEMAGTYRSPETGHTVELTATDRGLKTRVKGAEMHFVSVRPDLFYIEAGRPASLEFVRDTQGEVTGLRLHLMRSRNIRYERLP